MVRFAGVLVLASCARREAVFSYVCEQLSEEALSIEGEAYGLPIQERMGAVFPSGTVEITGDAGSLTDDWELIAVSSTARRITFTPVAEVCPAEVITVALELELTGSSGLLASGEGSITWAPDGDAWFGFSLPIEQGPGLVTEASGCWGPTGAEQIHVNGPTAEFAPAQPSGPVERRGLIVGQGGSCSSRLFTWSQR